MSSIFHPMNKNQLIGAELMGHSLPLGRYFKQAKKAQAESLHIFTEGEPVPPARRLIVILPDIEFDILTLPRQIRNLAVLDHLQILLLIKPSREENLFNSRVNLSTLASLIRDSRVDVQTHLVLGMSLVKAACQYSQPGDVVVCFAEHWIHGLVKKNRLAEILAQKTHLPVYTLKGSVSEVSEPYSAWLIDFVRLTICMAALIGFFILQVWLDRNTTGAFRTCLELLSMFAEVWVIATCAISSLRI
jgi:hypothetical protein